MCSSDLISTIRCSANSECGTDGFVGDKKCVDGNVKQDYKIFTCNNKGLPSSSCSSSTELRLVESCTKGCSNGGCIKDNLVLHLKFEEVSNGITQDSSIYDNDGKLLDAELSNNAIVGKKAMRFYGRENNNETGGVKVPTDESLTLDADAFTLALWIKASQWDELQSGNEFTERLDISQFVKRRNSWETFDFELINHDKGFPQFPNETDPRHEKLGFWYANDEERDPLNVNTYKGNIATLFDSPKGLELEENEWYHIVVVGDNNNWKMYINGELIKTKTSTVEMGNTDDIFIGAPFNGWVDDLRIYTKALNQNEINVLYNLKNVGECREDSDCGFPFENGKTCNDNNDVVTRTVIPICFQNRCETKNKYTFVEHCSFACNFGVCIFR